MNQVQVDVAETPCFVLRFRHLYRVVFLVVVVPQLRGHEYLVAFHESILDGASDTLTCLLFILIVVRPVKQSISYFDGLLRASVLSRARHV